MKGTTFHCPFSFSGTYFSKGDGGVSMVDHWLIWFLKAEAAWPARCWAVATAESMVCVCCFWLAVLVGEKALCGKCV